jgi:hypothetical protein
MIAANRARRRGSRGGSRRSERRSPRRSRRGASAPPSGPRNESHSILKAGGTATAVYGLAFESSPGSWSAARSAYALVRGNGSSLRDVAYRLKEAVPIVGTDPALAEQRATVAVGAGAALVGEYGRKIPIVKSLLKPLHKIKFKIGPHETVRVA